MVDALLGTGVNTPLSPLLTKIVATINGLAVPVLAVDLPSGLNGDTGRAMGAVVQATRTLTFIGIKQGMLTGDGVDCVGQLDCDPLGVTPDDTMLPAAWRIDYPQLSTQLTPRPRASHKGSYGKVLLVGAIAACREPSCWLPAPACGRGPGWCGYVSIRNIRRSASINPN